MKNFRLIALIKEVPEKPSIDFVLWFNFMRSISIKYSKLRKETYKIYGSCNKKISGSSMTLYPVIHVGSRSDPAKVIVYNFAV